MVLWSLLVCRILPRSQYQGLYSGACPFNTPASDMEEQREGPVVKFSDAELGGAIGLQFRGVR